MNRWVKFKNSLENGRFVGALFDYDGTLTPRFEHHTPTSLTDKMFELNQRGVVLGICTARAKETALPLLEKLIALSKRPDEVRKNWVLICENGSKGYYFNPENSQYECFYKAPWPQSIDRQELFNLLREKYPSEVRIFNKEISIEVFVDDADDKPQDIKSQIDQNEVSFIVRPQLTKLKSAKQCEAMTDKMYGEIVSLLEDIDPLGLLHVGNSKMGVSIVPANGDKDRGIKEFASLLGSKFEKKIESPYREIIAVGDQHVKGGNDFYFLKGDFGTSFTVGEEDTPNPLPHAVYNEDEQRLIGPEGTLKVLEVANFV